MKETGFKFLVIIALVGMCGAGIALNICWRTFVEWSGKQYVQGRRWGWVFWALFALLIVLVVWANHATCGWECVF